MHFDPLAHTVNKRVILRVAYPTNVLSIIDKTDFIPLKKDIMKQAFATNFTDKHSYNTAIYIGYNVNAPKQYSYIGWSGCISDFINYMNTDNDYTKSGDSKALSKWSEKAKIFPIRVIN